MGVARKAQKITNRCPKRLLCWASSLGIYITNLDPKFAIPFPHLKNWETVVELLHGMWDLFALPEGTRRPAGVTRSPPFLLPFKEGSLTDFACSYPFSVALHHRDRQK